MTQEPELVKKFIQHWKNGDRRDKQRERKKQIQKMGPPKFKPGYCEGRRQHNGEKQRQTNQRQA